MAAQSISQTYAGSCILHGYTYEMNPDGNTDNELPSSVVKSPGVNGTVFEVFPLYDSDREPVQKWPTMPPEMYFALFNIQLVNTPVGFTDEYGNTWTVLIQSFNYQSITACGDAYLGVQLKLYVVAAGLPAGGG